jgi:hypothetical protein
MRRTGPQDYPRTENSLLDDTQLVSHKSQITDEAIRDIVIEAIHNAGVKSGREILNIPEDATEEEAALLYKASGKELFKYFVKYCGDPAATAFQCNGRHYRYIAREQFHNRSLQKERMNSGWRYQYIAKDCANKSGRFDSVSDIGTAEADFNVTIRYSTRNGRLTIYVSVKNRTNTMGGQDWPKAIHAMENMARADKNRIGEYLCVFGIAMDKGERHIKAIGRTDEPYSVNTEVWRSDFFWPFFANRSYEDIMQIVLAILMESPKLDNVEAVIPEELIESFGESCRRAGMLDEEGRFSDPYGLVRLFCGASR